jgi:hypothetical protein
MRLLQHKEGNNKGQTAIIAAVIIMAIMITAITTIGYVVLGEYKLSQNDILASQTRYLAESGIENALLQIGENSSYTGGAFVSPIDSQINGTDNVMVTYNTSDTPEQATITSEATVYQQGTTNVLYTKTIQVVASLGVIPQIDNYAIFANNYIYGSNFTINGDIQSNNLLYLQNGTINAQNINAVGEGGGAFNNLDNMTINNTGGVVNLNGNILLSFINDSQITGELGCGTAFWGGSSCIVTDSTIGSQAQVSAPPSITLPTFDTSVWETYAQNHGTYFTSAPSFYAYLENYSSVSGGIDTLSPPPGVYYVNATINEQTLPSQDSEGNYIIYNFTGSTIITKTAFGITAGYTQTTPFLDSSTGKYLPAIITGKQGIDIDQPGGYPNAQINITGIIYSQGGITIGGSDNYVPGFNGSVTINGAIWSGNEISINESDDQQSSPQTISLDSNIVNNTEGFNTTQTSTQIISWNETN